MKKNFTLGSKIFLFTLPFWILFSSCESENDNPAGYVGDKEPREVAISVDASSHKPWINWVGGYVSVLGVNRGTSATLDESLVWLIRTNGNNVKFPIRYGELPAGVTDITSQYGGTKLETLSEDEVYTFWILKDDVWSQVSANPTSDFSVDSSLSSSVVISGDSVKINPFSYSNLTQPLDVFINIEDVSTFGRLGVISVSETESNVPVISWEINEDESGDPNISVIGISEGGQFNSGAVVWDVYSVRDSSAGGEVIKVYGKDNVISSPVSPGDSIPGTFTFTPFTLQGLERNKTYYIWIANKDWNGTDRARFTAGYAYATFNVE